MTKKYRCPNCYGRGFINAGVEHMGIYECHEECRFCKGKGIVDMKARMRYVREYKDMPKDMRDSILEEKAQEKDILEK